MGTIAVAAGADREQETTSAPAGISDPATIPPLAAIWRAITGDERAGQIEEIMGRNLPTRWTKLRPDGQPNPPSEMITSVVEAIYDDYAKVNFPNYELRREDLDQLAAFARQFKDVHEFLSQLALDQQCRCGGGAESDERKGGGKPFQRASSQRAGVSHRVRDLANGRNVSKQPLARSTRDALGRRTASFLCLDHARTRRTYLTFRTCG